jgi:hypothetical protein
MRVILCLVLGLLAGCADEEFAVAPPAGVDLSGHWKLNVADSDDPQRVGGALASETRTAGPGAGGTSGGRRGRGGGGAGGGGPGGGGTGGGGTGGGGTGGGGGGPGFGVPDALSVSALGEVLRWPGSDLEIKQLGGVAAFTSNDDNRVYQPGKANPKKRKRGPRQVVGWSGATLVVQVEPDDDRPPFEEHYNLTADGQRLVQLIVVKGGRISGFTMSRVWDRVP